VNTFEQGAMMTTEQDLTNVENDLVRARRAVRRARVSLNKSIREMDRDTATLRDIDQFTAREACTVLAALRVLQVIQRGGGALPMEVKSFLSRSGLDDATRITDMEHFETEAPLSVKELDDLCERIDVDFNR
jgi:hypothetical protein